MPPPRKQTPMSERQQMALLLQMTAPSDNPRAPHLKKTDHKKSDDMEELSGGGDKQAQQDAQESSKVAGSISAAAAQDEHSANSSASADSKKEVNSGNEHAGTIADVSSTNITCKRAFSDIDDDDLEDSDDLKKKKRKDSESGKDAAPKAAGSTASSRLPARLEKTIKQTSNAKGSPTSAANKTASTATAAAEKEQQADGSNTKVTAANAHNSKTFENEGEDEEFKTSENMYSGGPKVPPLKIVIPQQNCSIDDGNASRTGKVNISRNAALPYVVSSSNEANERDGTASATPAITQQLSSPHESPVKVNPTACTNLIDEKNIKLLNNEEKNLHRVLRSSHRTGGGGAAGGLERSSNNSSPQMMQSSSPSPASSHNANETTMDTKVNFATHLLTTSPSQQHNYDNENIVNLPSPSTSSTSSSKDVHPAVDLHPRKRKIRSKHDDNHLKTTHGAATAAITSAAANTNSNAVSAGQEGATAAVADAHPHDFPFTNCFQMYLNIRRQIEKKWKTVYAVKPRPPQGFQEYLLNKKTYLLSSTPDASTAVFPPATVSPKMRDIFKIQGTERHELTQRHTVEREKLCLSVEQEIIRVHSKAARNMASQSTPFSVCSLLKDEEVYNMITPEQEEKDRSARFRCNGRLLLSWLQDVDDKWEKIKESMVLRHHNEAESLHAVQLMDWEIALKKYELCDYKSQLIVDKEHVPIVHVSDDFDLLPA